MTKVVDFHITTGLPIAKDIVVTLPTGRDWWTALEDFEILMQGREEKANTSALIMDFTTYLTMTMEAINTVKIKFEMTGEETRLITKTCYYDIFMSDLGPSDVRGYVLMEGRIRLSSFISIPAVSVPEEP